MDVQCSGRLSSSCGGGGRSCASGFDGRRVQRPQDLRGGTAVYCDGHRGGRCCRRLSCAQMRSPAIGAKCSAVVEACGCSSRRAEVSLAPDYRGVIRSIATNPGSAIRGTCGRHLRIPVDTLLPQASAEGPQPPARNVVHLRLHVDVHITFPPPFTLPAILSALAIPATALQTPVGSQLGCRRACNM